MNERPIKNRTYNNFMRGVKIVMAKGYDEQTATDIVRRQFDTMEADKNGMPLQWYLDKIVKKEN